MISMKPTTIRYIALIYFAISIFVGCKNHVSTLQMGLGSSKQSNQSTSEITQSEVTQSEVTQNKHFGVVLLHGCMGPENELEDFVSKLNIQFGDDVIIIQPTCREEAKSIIYSIETQGKKVFKEIKSVLGTQAKSFPVFLIGYSQGGLVACVLGDQYKDKLNICGIVTWHTPLGGVPVLNRNSADIEKFMDNGKDGLQLMASCSSPDDIRKDMKSSTWLLTLARLPIVRFFNPGLQDMLPNSSCVQYTRSFLRESLHNIPCLLIAGYECDLSKLFQTNGTDDQSEHLKQLNQTTAEFITNEASDKHDMLIPLKSQLCRGPSFDDLSILTHADDKQPLYGTMPDKDRVQYHIFPGVTHSPCCPAMGGLCVSEKNLHKITIYNDQVYDYIIAFIQGIILDAHKQT